jgi:hypothetical protein
MEFIVDFRVVKDCLRAGEGANDLADTVPVDEVEPIERWTVLPTHIAPPYVPINPREWSAGFQSFDLSGHNRRPFFVSAAFRYGSPAPTQ